MCAWREEAESGLSGEESRRKRWVKAFEACDEDHKGYLNREDYKVAVVMLFGYKPSKEMAVNVGLTSIVEVDSVMASVKQNQSGRGYLSLEDFRKAFSVVAPKLPERTVVEAFREVDQDSDGHISFKDFESAMNYGQDNLSALPLI
ncbi:EF-hand calcium-binding domain-containing protein 11 isoform X5 [Podarcis raffonei]|uniref:EF-hand calcium-binding domain-containing protein 11 isoform X5 n=1 Tax=Podarcis raffonei TaxID=65483 RepID=UPI002329675E|nr:EF-hand calcium-binding domain-containing protein 11 isoform X5 [Podarcis raffonei]